MAKATFGAGCFWGVEEVFRTLDGVLETSVGYAGGSVENPTYEQVCTDRTGHAEVVQVTYNPEKVSYSELLDVFFDNHNPTQLNRQGPDVGSQYRSVVFTSDDIERNLVQQKISELQTSNRFNKPIVTTIEPQAPYWPAEDYHQKYLMKRGITSCHI